MILGQITYLFMSNKLYFSKNKKKKYFSKNRINQFIINFCLSAVNIAKKNLHKRDFFEDDKFQANPLSTFNTYCYIAFTTQHILGYIYIYIIS